MKKTFTIDFPVLRRDLAGLVADAEEANILLKVIAEGCNKTFVELSGNPREVINGLAFKYEYLE